nr:MAG TPA: hypothetical protein [Caudoviricetes sp.]
MIVHSHLLFTRPYLSLILYIILNTYYYNTCYTRSLTVAFVSLYNNTYIYIYII